MPNSITDLTNGYILNRLKTYSETSKWFIGGLAGILLFIYDKMHCDLLKLLLLVFSGFGIACLVIAYLGYKTAIDKIEANKHFDDSDSSYYLTRNAEDSTWPHLAHTFYKISIFLLILSSLVAFVPENYLFCHSKTAENQRSNLITITNNYTYPCKCEDSVSAPPSTKKCVPTKRNLITK